MVLMYTNKNNNDVKERALLLHKSSKSSYTKQPQDRFSVYLVITISC